MNTIDEFSRYYAGFLDGQYDCVDRLVINAYFPMGQTGGGMRGWWRQWRGDDATLDDSHLRDLAGAFSRRVRAYCEKHDIALIEAKAGERKHELAEERLPSDPAFRGLFLIITANAPAPVWEVKRNAEGKIVDLHHRAHWPYVKHYYFHLIDAEWGHVTVRMCGYPPFGAQVILNGHEWVERRAQQRQAAVAKASHCFVEGSDFALINTLAGELNEAMAMGSLRAVCDRWLYSSCLCFVLDSEEQRRSGFTYAYSVFQLELSRNLLFWRGATLDEVYQKVIDRTRQSLDVKQLKTIFGYRHRPHQTQTRGRQAPEWSKVVRSPDYDLTVFKVQWGRLTLKLYDKGERVLRAEVVVHNSKDLRCGRVLDKLPLMLERMDGMLAHFLSSLQAAHVSFVDEGAFEQWREPTTRGARRLAGIDLNKARNRTLVDAVVGLATQPSGFTLAQLAQAIQPRTGWSDETYSVRHAAYDLAKLRGKQLVHRCESSRRYGVEPHGLGVLCAYVTLRDKVIKPLLASIARPLEPSPTLRSPLDRHYLALRDELQRTFVTMGLAA